MFKSKQVNENDLHSISTLRTLKIIINTQRTAKLETISYLQQSIYTSYHYLYIPNKLINQFLVTKFTQLSLPLGKNKQCTLCLCSMWQKTRGWYITYYLHILHSNLAPCCIPSRLKSTSTNHGIDCIPRTGKRKNN